MAKLKGIVPLTGTLDGINFYVFNGKIVARRAGGGFTAASIKKSPNMVRVRENGNEFGHCSQVKKVFKDSLLPFLGMQKDSSLHSRMMQLFLRIKDCDMLSERGLRRVDRGLGETEGKLLLGDFEFTPFTALFLKGVYDHNSFTYPTTGFDVQQLAYPNGATHFELGLGIVVFDFEAMQAVLFKGGPVLIAKGTSLTDLNLVAATPTGNGMQIAVLHYRYLQEVNGSLYPLKDKTCYGVRVLDVR